MIDLNLYDILKMREFDFSAKTKMLRHQSSQYDVEQLRRDGFLEAYQSVQAQDILRCKYIVSFTGLGRTKACFAGVWEVLGQTTFEDVQPPEDFPYPRFFEKSEDVYYKTRQVSGYEDLIGRLIIDWGKGTRAWHQWLKDKPVLEILPEGHISSFPGYLDFVLNFDELRNLVNHADANRTWHLMLKSVAGIYLITDTSTGQQYVGSAYGKDGILGRWRTYVSSGGHGGNIQLKALLEQNPDQQKHFQFTILRTLPGTMTPKEVITCEQLFKRKLGSRAHGLNTY